MQGRVMPERYRVLPQRLHALCTVLMPQTIPTRHGKTNHPPSPHHPTSPNIWEISGEVTKSPAVPNTSRCRQTRGAAATEAGTVCAGAIQCLAAAVGGCRQPLSHDSAHENTACRRAHLCVVAVLRVGEHLRHELSQGDGAPSELQNPGNHWWDLEVARSVGQQWEGQGGRVRPSKWHRVR